MQQTVEIPQLQLIDKFGSCASRYAATGADGPESAVDGPEVWAVHHFDDELGVFFRALHTGAGPWGHVHRDMVPHN